MSLRLNVLLFFVTAFLAHGLLLVNDSDIADGWFLKFYMEKGDMEPYYHILKSSGAYVYMWIHMIFGKVSMTFYKVGMFFDILLNSILFYFLFRRYSPLKKNHCLFIAFLVLVWPAYHVSVDTTFFPVWFVQSSFVLGWLIFLYQKEKGGKFLLAFLAYVLIFISFNYNACLVYQYVFLGLFFLYINGFPNSLKDVNWRAKIPEFFREGWGLMVLPLVYWGLRQVYMKPYGTKLGYNRISLFSWEMVETTFLYLGHLFFDFFATPIYLGWSILGAFLVASLAMAGLFKRFIKNAPGREGRGPTRSPGVSATA